MRLLKCDNAGRITPTEDLPDAQRPKYAILSHTWSSAGIRDEVSLDDLMTGVGFKKPGYEKIRFCARQANRDGLDHFWVDTCCINKKSDAELSRSLRSMFRWYAEAERCYVYLSDVPQTPAEGDGSTEGDENAEESWQDDFRLSRWFKRGWTLQELLAPSNVDFFSRSGRPLGTKSSLERKISEITCIPISALRRQTLSDFTVQERLQWQEGRETQEPEDLVYSLFGIFDVSLPVLYGEGRAQAHQRLMTGIEANRKGDRYTDFSMPFSLNEVVETGQFVAREEELREIRDNLRTHGRRQYVILHGLGGIGKTQLSIAYALRHVDDYSAILWLNARDKDSIESGFIRIAKQILREHPSALELAELDLRGNVEKTVDAVKNWLSMPMNTRWLIVYDNYDNPAALNLRTYLPEAYQGSIIITTRSNDFQLGHRMHIKKLENLQDSLKILEHTTRRGDLTNNPDALRLARRLDGLPLALATAGAYLSQSAVAFKEYLDFFDQSWAELQQLSPSLSTYEDKTLFSTWQISFEQVEQKSALSANLLRWWAYFGNQDLWFELLDHCTNNDPKWMRELTRDKLRFHATLQVLCQHGLADIAPESGLEVESRGYSVHTCVHLWMITVLNVHKDDELAISALRCVTSHIPNQHTANSSLIYRRLLSHANQCLHHNYERCDSEYIACAYQRLGYLYSWLRKVAKAEELYQRALRGTEKILGPDHESTFTIINNLGIEYRRQGKVVEAEAMFQRALQGREKILGLDHNLTLGTINSLGNLYRQQEKMAEAEAMYRRALRGYENTVGCNHMSTLLTLNNLGGLYLDRGKLTEAEEMLQRALQGGEQVSGPDGESTLGIVENLGRLYRDQGNTAKAKAMYQRALRGYEKVWGPTHTSTLSTVHSLGILYLGQGEMAEAEAMYRRALRGLEKTLGPDHPDTLGTVSNLGCLYAYQGNIAEAEVMYKRLRDGYIRLPPSQQAAADWLGGRLSEVKSKRPASMVDNDSRRRSKAFQDTAHAS